VDSKTDLATHQDERFHGQSAEKARTLLPASTSNSGAWLGCGKDFCTSDLI